MVTDTDTEIMRLSRFRGDHRRFPKRSQVNIAWDKITSDIKASVWGELKPWRDAFYDAKYVDGEVSAQWDYPQWTLRQVADQRPIKDFRRASDDLDDIDDDWYDDDVDMHV